MKNVLFVFTILIFLFPQMSRPQGKTITDSAKAAVEQRIQSINERNKKNGYKWHAGVTSLSYLSKEEKARLCGLRSDTSNLRSRLRKAETDYQQFKSRKKTGLIKAATSPNWLQWMGKISDQGEYATCWAHAATGAAEALLHKYYTSVPGDSGIRLDENYIVGNATCGGPTGGYLWCGLDYMQYHRVKTTQGGNQFPNYDHAYYSISSYFDSNNETVQAIISALENSPVLTGMIVYDDFGDYDGGIYEHGGGAKLEKSEDEEPPPEEGPTHAVLIVGYNLDDEYWICRNSWGTDWGEVESGTHFDEKGYFRIRFRNCGIDSYEMASASITQNSCLAKLSPTFQTFSAAVGSSFATNEWVYVLGNTSLSSNLTIPEGKTIAFAPNVSLTTTAVLTASGNWYYPITFTSISGTSPGSWGSIVFSGSGANGSTLNHCNIRYGTEIQASYASNITIQYCAVDTTTYGLDFSHCDSAWALYDTIRSTSIYHGIVIENGSKVTCKRNVITKQYPGTEEGAGILYACESHGDVGQNDVSGWNWGIGTIWGSSPDFRYVPYTPNNRVTDCLYGVMAYQTSYPLICYGGTDYYYNSIHGNSEYDVYFTSGGALYAFVVWWGTDSPSSSQFYLGSGCYIYYDPWLEYDPWGGGYRAAPGPIALVKSSRTSVQGDVPEVGEGGTFLDGITLRAAGKLREAKDVFLAWIAKHPDDQAAYVELYKCYNNETAAEITGFFRALPEQAAKEHVLLLSHLLQKQGRVDLAKELLAKVIDDNPNTALGTRAKLDLFSITLQYDKDAQSASSILDEVSARAELTTPVELSLARQALNVYVGATGNPSVPQAEKLANTGLVESGVTQNYPNPFNPSTQIQYSITKRGYVTLKVFDMLGREVSTLVSKEQQVGSYAATWNASKFPSGVYFYRLQIGGKIYVKKMLYMK